MQPQNHLENVKNDTKNHHLYKKNFFSKTLVSVAQTEILHVESDSQIDTEKRLDVITTSERLLSQT